jgi:hypothetical protein
LCSTNCHPPFSTTQHQPTKQTDNWDGTNENDIAVVFLSQCAPLSDTVQPIPLATAEGELRASRVLLRGRN